MAPARGRAAEDAKADQTSVRERHSNAASNANKSRRNGANHGNSSTSTKESAVVAPFKVPSTIENTGQTSASTGLHWPSEDLDLLHGYRATYRLPVPTAFHNHWNAAILSAPGIGRHSPTMVRKKEKRKVGKEVLALSVRKHFNSLAINESEVIVDFLYKVKCQDKEFKLRSSQTQPPPDPIPGPRPR